MLVIRLARGGRNKYPVYRIVAADKRRAATGKFLAILGTYNPHTKDLKLDKELIEKYLKNGAQASDRVLRLCKTGGIDLPDWAKTHDRNKPSKAKAKEGKAKTEKPAEATAEVAAEATDKAEAKAASVDAPETAATEAAVADDQKAATEDSAKAAEAAEKQA